MSRAGAVQWRLDVDQVLDALGRRSPHLKPTLGDIAFIAAEITKLLPIAEAYADPGSGVRSSGIDGGGGRGGGGSGPGPGHSDPAGETATNHIDRIRRTLATSATERRLTLDALRRALSVLDDTERRDQVDEAVAHATRARSALHRALPRPGPGIMERLQKQAAGDPGCASCARVKDEAGKPYFEPTERTTTGGYRKLCRWCRQITADRRAKWIEDHPEECASCEALHDGSEPATCPGPADGDQAELVDALVDALGGRAHRWVMQETPDEAELWPPERAVDFRRRHGHTRIPPALWASFEAHPHLGKPTKSPPKKSKKRRRRQRT